MTVQQLFHRAPVTTLLLFSFIALFIIQVITGVDVNEPSLEALLTWGANALPYTLGYEPWRLVTSAFLHIGLMHLLFNAFAMYYFGQAAEVSFGSLKFLLLFLLSAVGGNLLNSYVTWWQIMHNQGVPGISAGASGGIMGIGMALLMVELFKNKQLNTPTKTNRAQLKNLAIIMGINLMYGFVVPGIDNAGHIGGAITGGLLALSIMLGYRKIIQQHYAQSNASNRTNTTINTPIYRVLPWLGFLIISAVFYKLWLDLHLQLGI